MKALKKLHYFSGLLLTLFIFVHLVNHLASLISIDSHLAFMEKYRLIYRNILVESVLLLAVALQVFSGIKLLVIKRKYSVLFFEKIHIYSGLYLAFFLIVHISAVMGGRYVLHLDTNFYFGAAGLNSFPFYFFFVPYYALAIMAVFGHIAAIHQQKMKSWLLGFNPQQQSWGILAFGLLATLAIFYGLTNHFQGVAIPTEYGVMLGK